MTSQIDVTKPVFGTPTTQSVRDNFTTAANEITALQGRTTAAPFLPLAGDRMTGAMYLFNDPTDAMMPATKGYVDAHSGAGGGGIPEAPTDSGYYGRFNGAWANVLALVGGTLIGPLILAADPTNVLGAATKQYVDTLAATKLTDAPNDANTYGRHANAWAGVLPIAGGQLTGSVGVGLPLPAALSTTSRAVITTQAIASSFNINTYIDTTGAFRYRAAGHAVSFGVTGTNAAISVALTGAADAVVPAWGAPLQIDAKGNVIAAGGPIIPTDTVSPVVSANRYVVTLGSHYAFNAYVPTPGTQWKYLAAGYAGNIAINSSTGEFDIITYPSGAAGGIVPGGKVWAFAQSGLLTTPGDVAINGSCNPSQLICYGRVYSSFSTNTNFFLDYSAPNSYVNFLGGYNFGCNGTSGQFQWWLNSTLWLWMDFGGNLVVNNSNAQKPSGGPWTAYSDVRVKRNVAKYDAGLAEATKLDPISYEYNGLGETRDDGITYYGLIAQAVRDVMPECVFEAPSLNRDGSKRAEILDGQLCTNLGPLTLAFINAFREIDARLTAKGI